MSIEDKEKFVILVSEREALTCFKVDEDKNYIEGSVNAILETLREYCLKDIKNLNLTELYLYRFKLQIHAQKENNV